MYSINNLLLLGAYLFISDATLAQDINKRYFKQETIKFYKETNDTSGLKVPIFQRDSKYIHFSFYEEFNDSLVLYLNKAKVGEWYIHKDLNPSESSGYSGIDCLIAPTKKRNKIYIYLVKQKKYIVFSLDRRWPLYTIQRYNEVWYVNARKYQVVLK